MLKLPSGQDVCRALQNNVRSILLTLQIYVNGEVQEAGDGGNTNLLEVNNAGTASKAGYTLHKFWPVPHPKLIFSP